MNKRRKDPHQEREAEKYSKPIASREYILSLLKEQTGPITEHHLRELLDISDPEDRIALQRRLKAMVRDAQIFRNRKGQICSVEDVELIPGVVMGHKEGYGFLRSEVAGEGDLFLNPYQMQQVMDGDRVLTRVCGPRSRGKREAEVVEIIERGIRFLVGRYQEERGIGYVIPENKRVGHTFLVPKVEGELTATADEIVQIEILTYPAKHQQGVARIVEVLGHPKQQGISVDIALRTYEIPHHWPPPVESECKRFGKIVTEDQWAGREDLRTLPLVTIDGEDARDFDDAVHCQIKPRGGYRLWVAIADVSYYVKAQTALDEEAFARGNSVYFPTRVIPMLPEGLSNELCSLKPEVDRLCMVAELNISGQGKMVSSRVFPAVMRSAARLTYNQVAAILASGNGDQLPEDKRFLYPHLAALHELYGVLAQAKALRGAIEFETTEARLILDEHDHVTEIVPVERNVAHKIIEECMLFANVAVARVLEKAKIPILYRVHELPPTDKLNELREFLHTLGLNLPGGNKPKPRDYAALLTEIGTRPDRHLIQTVLLRSMSQARYVPENVGHFGLAYDTYTHFTSPIRRYPDLLIHRALRHHFSGKSAEEFGYDAHSLQRIGSHCSMTERRADDATREVTAQLKCEYMKSHVGEEYAGVITSVTSFGLFIEITELLVEGLVHVTSLKNDYYHHDAPQHLLRGTRGGKVYRLGDPVHVQIMRVDLDNRQIDFAISEESNQPKNVGKTAKSEKSEKANPKGRNKRRKGPRGIKKR